MRANPTNVPGVSRPSGSTGIRWRILGLIFLASFVAYLLRTNMSVAGERMMVELGLTQVQLGIVLAAFAWGYAAFQFPGGVWGERVGSRKAICVIAIAWGVCNLAMGLVPGAGQAPLFVTIAVLVVLRALMGIAQAPFYPVTGGALTCNWFPVSGWAFPSSLANVGLTLGAAATGPLIAWLMVRFGWRMSFVLTAPIAFLVAAIWWWYVRDRPSEHPAVRPAELAHIDDARPASLIDPSPPGSAGRVIRDPQVLLLAASYFCSNYVFYFFFNWLYIYLVDHRGLKVLEGGLFSTIPWISGAIGALIGGIGCDWLSRRRGKRLAHRLFGGLGLAFAGAMLLGASLSAGPVAAVLFLALCLGFQQMTDAVFWSAAISISGRHSSSAGGVMNTGGNIVGGIGALLVPLTVRSFGWPAALVTGAGFAVVGAVLWIWIRADREFPEELAK
jgi:ACS family glucarate transporter-like MFS transporter